MKWQDQSGTTKPSKSRLSNKMASTDLSDVLGEAALQFVVGEDVIFVVKDQEKADNHDANDDDEGSLNFEMVEEFVLDDEEADFVHRKFSAKMCSSNEF